MLYRTHASLAWPVSTVIRLYKMTRCVLMEYRTHSHVLVATTVILLQLTAVSSHVHAVHSTIWPGYSKRQTVHLVRAACIVNRMDWTSRLDHVRLVTTVCLGLMCRHHLTWQAQWEMHALSAITAQQAHNNQPRVLLEHMLIQQVQTYKDYLFQKVMFRKKCTVSFSDYFQMSNN